MLHRLYYNGETITIQTYHLQVVIKSWLVKTEVSSCNVLLQGTVHYLII